MKKIILLLSILLFVSISVFASSDPNLLVSLNLSEAKTSLFGISTSENEPDVSSYDKASALYALPQEELKIAVNKTDMTNTATFWIWWYVFSPDNLKVFINVNPLEKIGTDAGTSPSIPLEIESSGSQSFVSTAVEKQLVKTLSTTELDKGSMKLTIQKIDKREFEVASYSSTITITVSTT